MTTTEPTTAVELPGPSTDPDEPPQPYAEVTSVEITKSFDLAQLLAEINTALKRNLVCSVVGPPDPAREPSEDNVAVLYLSESVDKETVEKVVEDHSPTPGWDVPEHEKAYREVLQAVVDDPETPLSAEQVEVAVRGLLLRSTMPTNPAPAPLTPATGAAGG